MSRRFSSCLAFSALALMLSACARDMAPSSPVVQSLPPPASAREAGVDHASPLNLSGIAPEAAARALAAFRVSCPVLLTRTDISGLTEAEDWRAPCQSAATAQDAVRFFEEAFAAVRVGNGQALATGYYEPEIKASRTPAPGYTAPIYRRPPDLVEADLGLFASSLKGRQLRGRLRDGRFIPYADRAEIEAGSLAGRGLELAWAADPVELFFLEVQGSGRLSLPDGSIMRIGYDGQNGHSYTAIGKLMRDRGLLPPQNISMQAIMDWLLANPDAGRALMNENKSYIFFREVTGPGPLGALGLPVAARATVAADPRFVPLGAPVFLMTDRSEANGLWVAQDVGGAIKGANRFDTFWGAGSEARQIAGGMLARGSALVLLPKASLARLALEARDAATPSQR